MKVRVCVRAYCSPRFAHILIFPGINLVGGNRVVLFDVCWNPSHDHEAMCRAYRYGQTKPTFIYRLVSAGTIERTLYDQQVRKEGMSKRIVDKTATTRLFTDADMCVLRMCVCVCVCVITCQQAQVF